MKNPNGYGTIKKLSGNRYRPYAFVISLSGKQKAIKYFTNLVDAKRYQANYKPSNKPVTFKSVYNDWLSYHLQNQAKTTKTNYKVAFSHCHDIHNLPIHLIKHSDLQNIINKMSKNGLSYSSCKKVKSLLNMVFNYAVINDLIVKNNCNQIKLPANKKPFPHCTYTRQQINKLWCNPSPIADTVLILLYTGLRVGELLALRKSNINLKSKYIKIVKAKTTAGIRIIPIHPKIYPLILDRYNQASTYLLEENNKPISYNRYRLLFKAISPKHTPHDTRHTVASLLDNLGANRNAIRKLLGHKGGDITDSVYTHKELKQLRNAINKLP